MIEKESGRVAFHALRNAILGLLVLTLPTTTMFAERLEQISSPPSKRAIVSPTVPRDSRGETVYETQGDGQRDLPVIEGVLLLPAGIKLPEPKYPKSLRKSHSSADVTVEGVVTPTGDFIDAKVVDQSDPEASANALAAVSQYKFKPATLDGKPIAMLLRVVVGFRIR
jgi:TonB family protein